MNNFWDKLKNKKSPILALAPMAGITDAPFRYMCEKYGADIVYSEMVNAQAICYDSEKTLKMLDAYKRKAIFIVQLFGNDAKYFAKAARIIEERIKPDGIDINLGCPAPKITKNKCGVELFKNLPMAKRVIEETIKSTTIPISIKVRVRVGDLSIINFLKYIEGLDIKAIMVHGRSLKQKFSGGFKDIDFKLIKEVKENFKGVVLGNGGIKSYEDAEEMIKITGVDGVGIAQSSLGRPWIFKEIKKKRKEKLKEKQILKIALEHSKIIKKTKGEKYLIEMRKHLSWYVSGFKDAKKIRQKFVQIETIKDIEEIIKSYHTPK